MEGGARKHVCVHVHPQLLIIGLVLAAAESAGPILPPLIHTYNFAIRKTRVLFRIISREGGSRYEHEYTKISHSHVSTSHVHLL